MDGGSREHMSCCRDVATLWREAGLGFGRLFRASAGFVSWKTPSASLAVPGVRLPDLNCGVIDSGDSAAEVVFAMTDRLRQRRPPGLLIITDATGPNGSAAAGEPVHGCGIRPPLRPHRRVHRRGVV